MLVSQGAPRRQPEDGGPIISRSVSIISGIQSRHFLSARCWQRGPRHDRHMFALCSVTALLGLLGRSPPPRMGGFEQRRGSTTALGQARVGLLVRGSTAVVAQLQDVCQASSGAPGIRGVIYRLTDDSAEVVAEGQREALMQLASSVADLSAEAAGAALCRKQGLSCRPAFMRPKRLAG